MKSDINKEFALIETILWDKEVKSPRSNLDYFFLLKRHINRVKHSALFFKFKFDKKTFLNKLNFLHEQLLNEKEIKKAKIKILFLRNGTIKIEYFPLNYEKVKKPFIDISSKKVDSKNVFLYHKTTKRTLFNNERERVIKEGLFETIFLNEKEQLTEGTITNLFLDLGQKELLTPKLSCGLLPGTLRQELLESGKAREEILLLDHLKMAKRIFVGNSVRGLIEVKLKQKSNDKIL